MDSNILIQAFFFFSIMPYIVFEKTLHSAKLHNKTKRLWGKLHLEKTTQNITKQNSPSKNSK